MPRIEDHHLRQRKRFLHERLQTIAAIGQTDPRAERVFLDRRPKLIYN
jgi:hypothetical protein